MNDTKIEWCDKTINPVVGCKGNCPYCYAREMNRRFGFVPNWNEPQFFPERLEQIRKLRNARRSYSVFLNSMSDVADWKPEWFDRLAKAYGAANMGKHAHDFIVLTKRPEEFLLNVIRRAEEQEHGGFDEYLPFLHIGITATNQSDLDERVPELLKIPAKSHFVSLEPLCGEIDLGLALNSWKGLELPWVSRWIELKHGLRGDFIFADNWIKAGCYRAESNRYGALSVRAKKGLLGVKPSECKCLGNLDAVIVGGMTGRNATPMHPDWVRSIRDQCEAAGVKFFFKSWGAFTPDPYELGLGKVSDFPCTVIGKRSGKFCKFRDINVFARANKDFRNDDRHTMYLVGSKCSGRFLDGITHNELPWISGGVR